MKLEKSKIYTTDVFVKNIYEIVQMVLCQDLVQVKMRNFSPF